MKPSELIADRFTIEYLAGAGGMGVVYHAIDRHTGAPVAIKILAHAEPVYVERFTREALLLAALDHPQIARYVAHGKTASGQRYIAMEWLEGESLAERLRREPLTIDQSLMVIEGVAEALAPLHARGLVHRDLKPTNLFLSPPDRLRAPKILDFGIARAPGEAALTRTGALVGTPGYGAPEQAQSGQHIDVRADVFALGCVLFECLTGVAAFVADNVLALLAKILLEEAPRVRERRDDVPPALDDLVARMLAKEPERRPRDARALLEELREIRDRRGAAPQSGVRPASITTGEQRLLSVVLASLRASLPSSDPAAADAPTDQQISPALRALADEHGASLIALLDGSIVMTFKGSAAATDQVVRAARAARTT
jgi:serine/threonine protein kinase